MQMAFSILKAAAQVTGDRRLSSCNPLLSWLAAILEGEW